MLVIRWWTGVQFIFPWETSCRGDSPTYDERRWGGGGIVICRPYHFILGILWSTNQTQASLPCTVVLQFLTAIWNTRGSCKARVLCVTKCEGRWNTRKRSIHDTDHRVKGSNVWRRLRRQHCRVDYSANDALQLWHLTRFPPHHSQSVNFHSPAHPPYLRGS